MSQFSIHILNVRVCPLCINALQTTNAVTVRSPEGSNIFLNDLNLILRETNSRGLLHSVSQNQLNPMRNIVLDFKNVKLHLNWKRNSPCGFGVLAVRCLYFTETHNCAVLVSQ